MNIDQLPRQTPTIDEIDNVDGVISDHDLSEMLLDENGGIMEHFAATHTVSEAEDTQYAEFFYSAIAGIDPKDFHDLSTREAYREWLATRSPNEVQQIEGRKDTKIEYSKTLERIKKTAPSLLEGKLPIVQLEKMQSERYVLGLNQSATMSLDDAIAEVQDNNGISLGIYNLNQRFLFVDEGSTKDHPADTEKTVVGGYYGAPSIGKFVIAIPMGRFAEHKPDYSSEEASFAYHAIEDFTVPTEFHEGESVNPKYIAGYIDDKGEYHANTNFMDSSDFHVINS